MNDESVHYYLNHTAERYPNKVAVTDGQRVLTYRELNTISNDIARFLVNLGVSCGDRVAYFLKRSMSVLR